MWNNFVFFQKEIDKFISQISATRIEVAEALACMEAEGKTGRYAMESKAWQSEFYAYIRMTHLRSEGRVEMLNFTIYPHTTYDLPIFASDLVLLKDSFRVAVVDAMPAFPNDKLYHTKYTAPLIEAYEASTQLGDEYVRKRDWSFDFLSQYACLRHQIPLVQIDSVLAVWKQYLAVYQSFTADIKPSEKAEQVLAWQADYDKKHLAVELERNPLMHYFGKELGERYQKEFLFRS
ncbi:MAG: hypothetical protein JJT94_11585 [Bernardetiaceae bacterium]|nr:hypothetical protein [Bernardetiaceae bacterium]